MPDPSDLYRDKTPSPWTKAAFAAVHLAMLGVVLWLLLGDGSARVDAWLGRTPSIAPSLRRALLAGAAALYFARMLGTTFVFLRRRLPASEVAIVGSWIGVFDLAFAYFGGRQMTALGATDAIAALLILAGSAINSGSEWQRHAWKRQSRNRSHLMTTGLFRLSRHANYFGDVVLFTGWAMLTQVPWLYAIPLVMLLGFVFLHVPAQDRYLEDRYGDEYRDYAKRTAKLIPFLY